MPLVAGALMILALLVLVITVANVVNLLYARAADREPDMPVYNIHSLAQQIVSSPLGMFPMRMGTIIAGGQGLIALFLATLGLYGLISQSVKRRTHEIGIRIALGATHGNVSIVA